MCNTFSAIFSYSPPITPEHYTCVGLALELWNRLSIQLESKYPGIGNHLCLVSCEEDIDSTPSYTALSDRLDTASYTFEKEHVLMCLKVEFSGRSGIVLCDPGYHVSRVITVMSDKTYPNTGMYFRFFSIWCDVTQNFNLQVGLSSPKRTVSEKSTTTNCRLTTTLS